MEKQPDKDPREDQDQRTEAEKMKDGDPQKKMRGPVSSFLHNLGENVRHHGGEHTKDLGSGGQKMDGYEDA